VYGGRAVRLYANAEWRDRARHKDVVMRFLRGFPRDLRRRDVDFGKFVVQPLRGEFRPGRSVCVGFDDLGAGLDVFAVNAEHYLRAGKVQLIVTAVDVYAF